MTCLEAIKMGGSSGCFGFYEVAAACSFALLVHSELELKKKRFSVKMKLVLDKEQQQKSEI